MDIYRDIIIDHFRHPHNFGLLKNSTVSHREVNSFCGDDIRMDLQIKNDQIVNVGFSGKGCAISIASASLLTDKIRNGKIEKVQKFTKERILELLGIDVSAGRIKCALLPLEVLQKALKKYG